MPAQRRAGWEACATGPARRASASSPRSARALHLSNKLCTNAPPCGRVRTMLCIGVPSISSITIALRLTSTGVGTGNPCCSSTCTPGFHAPRISPESTDGNQIKARTPVPRGGAGSPRHLHVRELFHRREVRQISTPNHRTVSCRVARYTAAVFARGAQRQRTAMTCASVL